MIEEETKRKEKKRNKKKKKRKKGKDLEVERGKGNGVSRNDSAESVSENGNDILGDLVDQLHKVGGFCRLLHR